MAIYGVPTNKNQNLILKRKDSEHRVKYIGTFSQIIFLISKKNKNIQLMRTSYLQES